jgi:hypothetical protein
VCALENLADGTPDLWPGLRECVQVTAGAECLTGPGDNERPNRVVGFNAQQGVFQLGRERAVQSVESLWSVEDDASQFSGLLDFDRAMV